MIVGTVGYMSPEQARGETADHRSDIFVLGLVLHEMLTGRQTFLRDSAVETMTAILKEDPPPLPPGTPPGLAQIVEHCLEKNPARRFQSAHDLAFTLRTLSASSTVTACPALNGTRARDGQVAAFPFPWALCGLAGFAPGGVGADASRSRPRVIPLPASCHRDGAGTAGSLVARRPQHRLRCGARQSQPDFRPRLGSDSAGPIDEARAGPGGRCALLVAGRLPNLLPLPKASLVRCARRRRSGTGVSESARRSRDQGRLPVARWKDDGRLESGARSRKRRVVRFGFLPRPGAPLRKYQPAPFEVIGSYTPVLLAWAPDGSKLMTTFRAPTGPQAWIIPFPDGESARPRRIFSELIEDAVLTFSWFPDSRHVAVAPFPVSSAWSAANPCGWRTREMKGYSR